MWEAARTERPRQAQKEIQLPQYGRWRPVIGEVMRKYLDCGDLHRGFARLGCDGCRYQAILAYSRKCRLFCPSCQQKRVLLFAERLDTHILEQVSHAQFVFTIPKLLRPIFKFHPKELGLLCKSPWQSLKEMFQEVAADPSALPGVVLSVQSYGDSLNLHPHIHAIASRGVWSADGSFQAVPALDTQQLMLLFRHHVVKNLLAAGRISQAAVHILDRFHHPGFPAYEEEGVSARETFRAGGAFSSIPAMGQRDLTIKWAIGAGKAKEPLIKKGHIVDDGGAFFGWGVEQGHLGKTEIFCKFDPQNLKAKAAVEAWSKEQSARAFNERYFAVLMGPVDEMGPGLSNYHLWWKKIRNAIDPNNVSPEGGALV